MLKGENKKKILLIHFNRYPPNSGGEFTYYKIYQSLSSAFDVNQISTSDILYKYFPNKIQRRINRCILEPSSIIYPLLAKNKYSLIFTSWTDFFPFFGDLVYAQPLAGSFSKKIDTWRPSYIRKGSPAYTAFNAVGENYCFPWIKLNRWFSLKYMTFISNSRSTQKYIKTNYGKDSVVVYPPVEVEKYLFNPKIVKENLVLTIGNVIPQKRHHVIGLVGPYVKNSKFVLIGDMPPECKYIVDFIKKQFKIHGRADDFIYYGKVSEEFKVQLLNRAKVLFHPAIDEAFGIAIVEGMAAGAVPVVHNSGGPTEFLKKENLFDTNTEAIEKVMIALSQGNEKRESLVMDSLFFSDSRFKKEIVSICQERIR